MKKETTGLKGFIKTVILMHGHNMSLICISMIIQFVTVILVSAQPTGEAEGGLLNKPKDIVYDQVRKCSYISNYQGDAIVRQDSSGNQEYMLQGINSPMGLHLLGDTLVISSNAPSKITLMNVMTFSIILEIPVPAAQFLSMMDRDPRTGLIYIVEQIGAIYKLNLQQSTCSLFVPASSGIAYGSQTLEVDTAGNRLLVFKWDPGFVKGVNLNDSTDIFNASSQYISQIQSSQKGPEGEIYVSSYNNNSVYIYDKYLSAAPSVIASGLIQPSGIAYNPHHHSLMVCNYGGNFISEIPLFPVNTDKFEEQAPILQVFPSPAGEQCMVTLRGLFQEKTTITLLNHLGIPVRSVARHVSGSVTRFSLCTGDLPQGAYIIICASGRHIPVSCPLIVIH
jgi:hypothetical protein